MNRIFKEKQRKAVQNEQDNIINVKQVRIDRYNSV